MSTHPRPRSRHTSAQLTRGARGALRTLRALGAIGALGALGLGLTACASGTAQLAPATSAADDRPVVLTTFTVLADIAEQVAGPHLRVESITKVGAEIHGYEPTPGDIARASEANLILDNGLGLEAWFEKFVSGLDVPHVVVTDEIDPLPIADDADAGKANPHAWMSPRVAQQYVDAIAAAFTELDPAHAAAYTANAEAYRAELQEVHETLLADLAELPPSQRALVTCEGAFSYLARDAGLTEQYIWPVNAEQQATPQQIARTIEFVRANDVPAVFCESTVSDAPMQQVVAATDASYGGTLYVDSLSEPGGPVPSYLELIRHDAATITAALTGAAE
ncbi:metal ABC transporter substrate-binding protein [Leucobacter luti]|uniref:Manganese transport system substrate-binding protein n=1 Tax=Leucobacter luti TaxID=340320 RepID=A0A4Q7TKE8_9MICO|nr:metal ABC transporter substrate-binding protein [Leucobacter luti]MBL3700216.1 metal ABC transporter substrate-binding protein [Leucobacter luti]RZT61061.1 manganese transport system substrate-binding protein [Leucobacter luti]